MNQSAAIKQAPESSISGQSNSNVITLKEIEHQQIQARRHAAFMLRQKLSGALLLVIGFIVWAITRDLTILIFLSPFYGLMILNKNYIMQFKGKR